MAEVGATAGATAPATGEAVGMSRATARRIEGAIIGLCVAALLFVFQPFNKLLSGVGMGLVVLGGLAFNLVPFCEPGRPARQLVRAALVVALVFVVVLALALLSAHLYGLYLRGQRAG